MMWVALLIGLLTSAVALLGVIVWRQAVLERRRSEARIAALAQAIDGSQSALEVFGGETADNHSAGGEGIALTVPASTGPSRVPAFAVAVVVVLGLGALVSAALSGADRSQRRGPSSGASIELVSLRHVVDGDTLIVTGLVRNASTVSLPPLAAEISVLGRNGHVVARSRSTLEPRVLGAGKETSFRVDVSEVKDPERYRVAFSTGNQIVPHVDRRNQARAARTIDQ